MAKCMDIDGNLVRVSKVDAVSKMYRGEVVRSYSENDTRVFKTYPKAHFEIIVSGHQLIIARVSENEGTENDLNEINLLVELLRPIRDKLVEAVNK